MSEVTKHREPSKIVQIETKEVVSVRLTSELLPIEWDYILALTEKTPGYYITNIAVSNGGCYVVVSLTRGTNIVEGYTPPSFKADDDFLPGIEVIEE